MTSYRREELAVEMQVSHILDVTFCCCFSLECCANAFCLLCHGNILLTVPDIKTDPSSTVSTADLPMELEKLSCAAGQSCQCVRKHERSKVTLLINHYLLNLLPSSIFHSYHIFLPPFYQQCCNVTQQEVVIQVSNRWTLLLLPPCPVQVVQVDDIYT